MFLTPGEALWRHRFALTITAQGARTALLLITRVETAVTLSALLVLTTPWMHLLKALRTLRVPVEVIVLLAMTHRYVILLAETANQMFESRQSRMVGRLSGGEQRRLMVNSGGVLLSKTLEMGDQVYLAMQARGFRGEVRLLDEFRLRGWDYAAMCRVCGGGGSGGGGGKIRYAHTQTIRCYHFVIFSTIFLTAPVSDIWLGTHPLGSRKVHISPIRLRADRQLVWH